MSFWRQLKFLLHKNYLIRIRQKKWAVFEIFWPLILFMILVWVRTRDFNESHHECHYVAKAMPSAGFLPFMQSYLCTFIKNTCFQYARTDVDVGLVNTEHSLLNFLTKNVQLMLGSGDSLNDTLSLIENVERLFNLSIHLLPASDSSDEVTLASLLKDQEEFVSLAIRNGMTDETARSWINAGMRPSFFIAVFDILSAYNVTMKELSELSFDSIFALMPAVTELRSQLYCNATNFVKYHNISKLGAETAIQICRMNFWSFWFDVYQKGLISRDSALSSAAAILQNATGFQFDADSVNRLNNIVMDIQNDLAASKPLGMVLLQLINFTKQDATTGGDSKFRRSFCGNMTEGAEDAFRGMSRIERVRARFIGEKVHASKLLIINNQSILTDRLQEPDVESALRERKPIVQKPDELPFDDDTVTNGTKIICDFIPLDVAFESKCWDWLKSIEVPAGFQAQIFSILRGYILISPDTEPIQRISLKLARWLENIVFLKKLLTDLDLNANVYQDVFSVSELATSVNRLVRIARSIFNLTHFLPADAVHQIELLESLFLNSSDPSAALPLLRKYLLPFINATECFRTNRFIRIVDESSLEELAMCLTDYNEFFGAITFQDMISESKYLNPLSIYKIRLANYLTDSTVRIQDKTWNPRPRDRPFIDLKYLYYGFSHLQDALDRAIIEEQTNLNLSVGIYTQQFPNPCFSIDGFVKAMARLLPLCMTLAWVLSASLIVKNIVYEKELRLKEFMKVMGLGNAVHWVAWFIQSFSIMLISIVAFAFLVKVGRVVEKANVVVLMVFLALYATATITQCFLVSTIFDKANVAAACGGFIYFLLFLPYPISLPFVDVFSFGEKAALCLFAQVAFGFGCNYISMWEMEGDGLRWSNLHLSPDLHDNFNCMWPMLFLILDSVLYCLAAWYIEAVFPGAYGIPKPWYFFMQRSFWCGHYYDNVESILPIDDNLTQSCSESEKVEKPPADLRVGVKVIDLRKVYGNGKVAVDGLSVDFYENQITSFLGHNGAGKTTTISILTGLYPSTSGTVLVGGKDIRTNIAQIRRSLGMCPQHNVLFDILTVEEQLRFYAGLKGLSNEQIPNEINRMLKMLNLEKKRNILAKYLSGGMQRKLSIAVAFMGNSKLVVLDEPTAGVDPYSRRQIWDLLVAQKQGRTIILSTHHMDEADLLGDRIAIIGSGKLKCCGSSLFLKKLYGSGFYLTFVLSNAFRRTASSCGSKMTYISDEPERRAKSADQSNRVPTGKNLEAPKHSNATVASPKLTKISGVIENTKPDYLKIPRNPSLDRNSSRGSESIDCEPVKTDLLRFVDEYVTGGRFVERVGQELTFALPRDQPRRLAALFVALDGALNGGATQPDDRLRTVVSYGISETKLEEIFLKVDPKENEPNATVKRFSFNEKISGYWLRWLKRDKTPKQNVELVDASSSDDEITLHDEPLVKLPVERKSQKPIRGIWWLRRRQFRAIFVKRFLNFSRNLKGAFCEIILPVIVIACTMAGLSLQPSSVVNQPSLRLSPWLYGPPNYVFFTVDNEANSSNEMAGIVLRGIVDPPGLSYRCMPSSPFTDLTCLNVSDEERYHGAKDYHGVVVNQSMCYCDSRSDYKCPTKAYNPNPPSLLLNTSDYLTNMTMLNITQWLLMTERKFRKRRYGGFSLGETNPVAIENTNWSTVNRNIQSLKSALSKFSERVGLDWNVSKKWPSQDISFANETMIPYAWTLNFTDGLSLLLSGSEVKDNIKVWFNNQGWASLPSYVNVLSNAILRAFLPKSKDPTKYGIVAFNHPMNYSKSQQGQRLAYGYNVGVELTAAIMIMLSFSVIPASFVLFIIDERVSDSKHLQFVSGVEPNVYWFANFAWDMVNFMIPVAGVLMVFLIFNEMAYVGWFRQFAATALLLYVYGFATIPIMYSFSHLFRVPSLAFICLATANLFFGWITTTMTATLELLGQDDPEILRINEICMQAFLVLPQYCLGRGMLDLKIAYFLYLGEQFAFGEAAPVDPFRWVVLGRNFLVMFIEGILAFIIVLYLENYKRKAKRYASSVSSQSGRSTCTSDEELDDDVIKEHEYANSLESANCAVRIVNLTKDYPNESQFSYAFRRFCCCKKRSKRRFTRAVGRLCMTVQAGECFGLLGINGAGKTTTFNMLTGKISISSGEAYFGGLNVLHDRDAVRKHIGFCPQFDALNLLLNAEEQLTFYARLRGLEEDEIQNVVNVLINRLNLSVYANRLSMTYSGGNKRKLSTAIALIGDPSVVLFDEPTTGMDPKSRRFLWNKISEITRDGRSVVLTSHSMEECEALCSRIGIMASGQFRCLGSVQHLKNKYGSGYTLTLKLANNAKKSSVDALERAVLKRFADADLKERHLTQLRFRLPSKNALSDIFDFVVTAQQTHDIEDYSLRQTTLDEVFVSFAAQKRDEIVPLG